MINLVKKLKKYLTRFSRKFFIFSPHARLSLFIVIKPILSSKSRENNNDTPLLGVKNRIALMPSKIGKNRC